MIHFYDNTNTPGILFTMLLVAVAAIQSYNWIGVTMMQFDKKTKRIRGIFEMMLLIYILLIYLTMSFTHQNELKGISLECLIPQIRIAYCTLMLIFAAYLAVYYKRVMVLPLMIVFAAMLPIVESKMGHAYIYFMLLVVLYLGVRGCLLGFVYNRFRRDRISGYAVKQALDKLPSALLVTSADGDIILMNQQMMNLSVDLMDRVPANGNQLYWALVRKVAQKGDLAVSLSGKIISNPAKENYWYLQHKVEYIDNKDYSIITASDITQEWNITMDLEKQNKLCEKQGKELKAAIQTMEEECREQEISKLKAIFHDVMGQKIALLLRALQEKKEPEDELLTAFSNGLTDEIMKIKNTNDSKQQMAVLIETFAGIDVSLKTRGYLPEDKEVAGLMIDLIRETSTNAVRHGFAKNINVVFRETEKQYIVKIANDGQIPPHNMTEGNGIRGMRKKLAYVGGSISIDRAPEFTVTATIPKK